MQVCIHRGTQQIGGTCIELASGGQRILLDLGRPLDLDEADAERALPVIPGLRTGGDDHRPGAVSRRGAGRGGGGLRGYPGVGAGGGEAGRPEWLRA